MAILLIPATSTWRPMIESRDGFTDDFMEDEFERRQ